jgi:GT2 family glycosyltransferase
MKSISFITNTGVDTLEYTKLLLESLKNNLVGKEHEIIVFIDKDNDGTKEYLDSIKSNFYDLKIVTHKLQGPIGYQRNSNLLVDIAKHDIVSYLQSDMVISPNYDINVLSQLKDNSILSTTRIEPPLHGHSDYTITEDFGTDPTQFNMEKWNEYSQSVKSNKLAKYFFAPYTFYKKVWQNLGGYDTRFRRAREDSDFVQRAVHAGVELIQTWEANVYHFTCVSSRGKNWFDQNNEIAKKRVELQKIADGIELRRFIKKWGGFNHGENKLSKLDMDLVIKDNRELNPMFLAQVEVYFSRVWLKTEDHRQKCINLFSREQDPANELLGFSKEGWEVAKKLYNQTNFEEIYKVGIPEDYNIKVEVDFTNADPKTDLFIQNVTRLYDIVGSSEPGIYELGSAKIEVKNLVNLAHDQIVVNNPPFDYSLLTIE